MKCHLSDVLPRENWMIKIKNSHEVVQSINTVFAGLWHCEIVMGGVYLKFLYVSTSRYTTIWYLKGICKKASYLYFISLILTLVLMIFTSSCTWNYAQKFFYGKFLCLKVFEVNLKLCCYNSFPGPETNQMWSKHGFHKYIDCYGLERHVVAIWVKLEQKLCRKEKLWQGMENDRL